MRKNLKQRTLKMDGTTFYRCAHPQNFAESKADEFVGEWHDGHKLSNGTWEIPNFKVFAETKRFNSRSGKIDNFDSKWLRGAAKMAETRRKRDKFLPPIHVKHTDDSGNKEVKFAGRLKDLRTERAEVEGEEKEVLVATLTEVPDKVFKQMEAGEYGYRSVEINKPDTPEISSLALLDYEVPYFKFPVARVRAAAAESNSKAQFAEAEDGSRFAAVFPWPARFCMGKKYEADSDDSEEKDNKKSSDDSEDKEDQKMMAGMGDAPPPVPPHDEAQEGDAMTEMNAKLDQLISLLTSQAQQTQAPPPAAPVAAAEPSTDAVQFKEKLEELATLKAQFADREKEDAVARKFWELKQERWEQDAAGGGKNIIAYNPQALQQFAETAKMLPADQQDNWWKMAEEIVKREIVQFTEAPKEGGDTSNLSDGQKFAESVKDDDRFKDRDPATVAAFREAYDTLPEGRKQHWVEEGGPEAFVHCEFLKQEYSA